MKKCFLDPDVMGDLFPIIMTSLQQKIEGKIETTIQSTIAKSLVATITVTIHEAPDKIIIKFRQEVIGPLLNQRDEEIKLLKSG